MSMGPCVSIEEPELPLIARSTINLIFSSLRKKKGQQSWASSHLVPLHSLSSPKPFAILYKCQYTHTSGPTFVTYTVCCVMFFYTDITPASCCHACFNMYIPYSERNYICCYYHINMISVTAQQHAGPVSQKLCDISLGQVVATTCRNVCSISEIKHIIAWRCRV